ncbi:hypothetical protein [Ktedonospora formicarum]|uniref:Uncharacterized protein n=1 Tax=Ktedonospora formicarum TaxID=2778364 RepID=A0A8J3MSV9_9CHLR|nr:hypothetical protein [Ktedonospora formicarum]GHO45251.1 hypothetical protein KSX_34140 [Ktedonospora formicarum]
MTKARQWASRWLKNWYVGSVAWTLVGIGWLVLFLFDQRQTHIITALASFVVGLTFFLLARQATR